MTAHTDIDLVVFDILGTLVDEPGGVREAIGEAAPDGSDADRLVDRWFDHVETEQQKIVDGLRPFVNGDILNHEAAQIVAAEGGFDGEDAIERLATSQRRLAPWLDTVDSLARLSQHFPVVGLSNASRETLIRLSAYAGLRWHYLLSAEEARSYKPAPEVYRLAFDLAGVGPERILMVAAHAWDLRGAQAAGFRTAFVQRPVGDAPTEDDGFDYRGESLAEVVDQIALR
ncbi:haloacid dehalogenase type II [Glycomyces harbinensis]|uniref:2-haloacid dehalogenase n=1 Tax=Glycomyces harbinensis TaxID=58114 RepID=A0A1G7C266_9ACTN|nr:haloacid dehalogenase type II [Glycomyces harbinensis]SDE32766.1 2-haloacid dehalogenase [Glycomyces harbinensis]